MAACSRAGRWQQAWSAHCFWVWGFRGLGFLFLIVHFNVLVYVGPSDIVFSCSVQEAQKDQALQQA